MATRNSGFFRNAFNALIAARERQASSYVNGALLMLDDETLKAHGYSRSELRKRPSTLRTCKTRWWVSALQVKRYPSIAPESVDMTELLAAIGGQNGVALTLKYARQDD